LIKFIAILFAHNVFCTIMYNSYYLNVDIQISINHITEMCEYLFDRLDI